MQQSAFFQDRHNQASIIQYPFQCKTTDTGVPHTRDCL